MTNWVNTERMTVEQFDRIATLLRMGITPEQFGGPYTMGRAIATDVQRQLEVLDRQGGEFFHICAEHRVAMTEYKPGYIRCDVCHADKVGA